MGANALMLLESSAYLMLSSASKLFCKFCLSKHCLSISAYRAAMHCLPFSFCLTTCASKGCNLCLSHFMSGESFSSVSSLASKPVSWEMQVQRITLQITQTHTLTSQDTSQPPHQPRTPPPGSNQRQLSQMILFISQHNRLNPTTQCMSQQWPLTCPLSSGPLQLT